MKDDALVATGPTVLTSITNTMASPAYPPGLAVDRGFPSTQSLLLRYQMGLSVAASARTLASCSIREGAQLLNLTSYDGVNLDLLDLCSLAHTGTFKALEACLTAAICKERNVPAIVFCSGANTGQALCAYASRAGIECFFFCPTGNLHKLDVDVLDNHHVHLIAVDSPDDVKYASAQFSRMWGLWQVPQTEWRYAAAEAVGYFVAEHCLRENISYDWIVQTISAAFGPIGYYNVLQRLHEQGLPIHLPRFLGVQQEDNSPMFDQWAEEARGYSSPGAEYVQGEGLLEPAMFDRRPQTYGTYHALRELLQRTSGAMVTISDTEFRYASEDGGVGLVRRLLDVGMDIRRRRTLGGYEVVEKAGLMCLAATLKAIEGGTITHGSRVLCVFTGATGAISDEPPRAELRIVSTDSLDHTLQRYGQQVFAGRAKT